MATSNTHHSVPTKSGALPEARTNENAAAPGVPYYTPLQDPPAGAAIEPEKAPKIFKPLKIRGLTLQNHIMVSPMCQYSADYGHLTDWHLTHLGGIIQRGPGLTCVEATSVTPEGRITPEDSGLWTDSQIPPLKRIVDFAHSQNQHIMIQLGHAGRKASTVAPWLSKGATASEELHGWPNDCLAPSAIRFSEDYPQPKEMTKAQIGDFKEAYGAAVKRALTAGFDAIEIHAAHGYLLGEFHSPAVNKRTDEYGGSFENRIRLTLETIDLVRGIIPKDMPLFLRVSATDWLEENEELKDQSWKLDDTVKFAKIIAERGVDLIDVSSGGSHSAQHVHSAHTKEGLPYQSPFSIAVKKAVGDSLLVGAVGNITTAKEATQIMDEGVDMIIVARAFQKNPGLVFAWADELGAEVNMPNQIRWGFGGRGSRNQKKNAS